MITVTDTTSRRFFFRQQQSATARWLERSVLGTQRAATQIERERALDTVGLIRALGGGWEQL